MRPFLTLTMAASLALIVAVPALADNHEVATSANQEAALQYDLAWHNRQQAVLAGLDQRDGWRVIDGGLRWKLVSGDNRGPKPSVADTVTVHYAGRLVDGTEFDSSYERGEPATFPLGRLIKAWQLVIPQMAVGDTAELYAPADLAYGPNGKGEIPGNATLIFKVELLDIAGVGSE